MKGIKFEEKRNEMKRIILKYSFHPLVWEFQGRLIPLYSLKSQNLKSSFPPKLGGIRENEIKFNKFFIKNSKIPLCIQPFILKLACNFMHMDDLKSSFPPKLGGIRENEIKFNKFFIKTSKIPLCTQPFILKLACNFMHMDEYT